MKALVINCTLKRSPDPSNTDALARVVVDRLEKDGVRVEVLRAVDLDIEPGVTSEPVREGDAWPAVHAKLLDAEILVMASPT
ncbi:hypothetical protein GCM10010350_24040 [Streptomyces galilaeus]|nr:hypothetical protein GCM10010350_24040 [Streptomyces galilaeus]